MTRYIVNSGGIKRDSEKAKAFATEIVKGLGDHPRILYCYFANPRQDWEEKFSEYSKGFKSWLPEAIQPGFEMAMPDIFDEQIKRSDAIYMHGGDDHLLMYWLRQFDIPRIWEGKTVATNSASSDALSKYFWTCDWRQCMEGLGILPIKFIPHYLSDYGNTDPRGPVDWHKAYDDLKMYGDPSVPIHALEEGDYIVFEQ